MSGADNLKGHGFHERTAEEQRQIAVMGGKASGVARRRKADFRKALNMLLTCPIDDEIWKPTLEAMGLECTVETAVNAAMIRAALSGDVKAYIAIRDTLGQTTKSEDDLEEQKLKIKQTKRKMGDDDEQREDDGLMDALNATAATDWENADEAPEGEDDETGAI